MELTSATPLPRGGALVRRILLYTGAYSLCAIAVITLYLSGLLQQVAERTRSNEQSTRRLDIAMGGLRQEAENLRTQVCRFRI